MQSTLMNMPLFGQYKKKAQAQLAIDRKKTSFELSEILYLEAVSNYTLFHFANGKTVLLSKTLKEFAETCLANDFVRIHKSYLVNMHFVMSYQTKVDPFVTLMNGTRIEISRRRRQDFELEVAEFIRRQI